MRVMNDVIVASFVEVYTEEDLPTLQHLTLSLSLSPSLPRQELPAAICSASGLRIGKISVHSNAANPRKHPPTFQHNRSN